MGLEKHAGIQLYHDHMHPKCGGTMRATMGWFECDSILSESPCAMGRYPDLRY